MPAAPAPAAEVRARVMAGMIEAVEARGYAATTIGDIAKAAKMSRRTLYEHFPDKQACFLAAYNLMSDTLITAVVEASRTVPPGIERVRVATTAYLDALGEHLEVARSFFTEILAVGEAGVALRCQVNQRFAAMLSDLMAEAADSGELADGIELRELTPELAIAIVGAVNELVLQAIVTGPRDTLGVRLRRLQEPVLELGARMFVQPAVA